MRIHQFSHEGRVLEVRANVIDTLIQIWIFENDLALVHGGSIEADSAVDTRSGVDIVDKAMWTAQQGAIDGTLLLPPRPLKKIFLR